MNLRNILTVWTLSLISFTNAYPLTAPVPPSQDEFYSQPSGFESASPGDILKSRPVPGHLRSFILPVNVKSAWQLLVRSSDSRGNPTCIVTTVIEPYNADTSKIVSYQIAEDAAAPDCSMSYAMQLGAATFSTLESQVEFVLIQTYLSLGYYVVVPDYEGLKGSFSVGRQEGKATLDSLRGALSSSDFTGVDSDAKVVLTGYSGGSIASSWAAALQPKYAPELKPQLLGVAIGGWVTNLTATVQTIDGGVFSGFTIAAVNGLYHEYPELKDILDDQLYSTEVREQFEDAGSKCLIPILVQFFLQPLFTGPNKIFKSGWDAINIPLVQEIIYNNTLGMHDDEMPEIPFFVIQSVNDEVAPYEPPVSLYHKWCDMGFASMEFNLDHFNEHVSEAVFGSQAEVNWIIGLFNGTKPFDGCKLTERFENAFIPGFLDGLKIQFDATVDSILGYPVGPSNSSNAKRDMVLAELTKTNIRFNMK